MPEPLRVWGRLAGPGLKASVGTSLKQRCINMQLPRAPAFSMGGLHPRGSLGTGPGSIQAQGWRWDQRPGPGKGATTLAQLGGRGGREGGGIWVDCTLETWYPAPPPPLLRPYLLPPPKKTALSSLAGCVPPRDTLMGSGPLKCALPGESRTSRQLEPNGQPPGREPVASDMALVKEEGEARHQVGAQPRNGRGNS